METQRKHTRFDIILFKNKVCIVKKSGAKGEIWKWSDSDMQIKIESNIDFKNQSYEYRERNNLHSELRRLYDRETMTISNGKYVTFKTEDKKVLSGLVIRGGRAPTILLEDGTTKLKIDASDVREITPPIITTPEILKKWIVKELKFSGEDIFHARKFSLSLYKERGVNKRPLKLGGISSKSVNENRSIGAQLNDLPIEFIQDMKELCDSLNVEYLGKELAILFWLGIGRQQYVTLVNYLALPARVTD